MPRRPAKQITLADVAAAAKVSQATVCRVLNQHPTVSDQLRQRVLAAIKKTGMPSRSAGEHLRVLRPMTTGQGATRIEVLVMRERGIEPVQVHADSIAIGPAQPEPPGYYNDRRHAVQNSFYRSLLDGVHEEAGQWGYSVAHRQVAGFDDGGLHDAMQAADLAGIVVMGEYLPGLDAFLARHQAPVVLVDLPEVAMAPTVTSDDNVGMALVLEHLTALGHRRIAYAGALDSTLGQPAGGRRFLAWRRLMADAGLAVEPHWQQIGQGRIVQAKAWAEQVLAATDRPSAVVCQNDFIALAIIEAARVRGLSIPGELSVVGYDDSAIAALTCPALTTVAVPTRSMGQVALHELLLEIARPDDAPRIPRRILLTPQLVGRQSTAGLSHAPR